MTAQTPLVDAPVVAKITKARVGSSLYVTYLDKDITKSSLRDFFGSSSVGPTAVASIRVCRDSKKNTTSIGSAFANFHKSEDAQIAMDELNNTSIIPGGPPCRIVRSVNHSIQESGVGNVFIKNLDEEIDNEALFDAFSSYGDILSCKVSVANGVSRGFGYVQFAKLKDSEKAIAALHGKCFNGKQVFVGPFIPRSKRQKRYTNIYLNHINPEVTSEQFHSIVEKLTADIGKITSPKLMVKNVEKDGEEEVTSCGFGFVNFESHEVAVKALERFKDDAKVRELAPEFIAPAKNLYANPS